MYGVDASSSTWSISLYAIPKWASRELEDNRRLLPSFEGEHLVHARETYLPKPLGGNPGVLTSLVKIIQFSQMYLYDWVDLWKSSAKEVTHPSTKPNVNALG